MKAILNNEIVFLNEVPIDTSISPEQITEHDNKKYFNPSGAVIFPDVPDKPSKHHVFNGTEWTFDQEKQNQEKLDRTKFSKLEIRRAMRNLNVEDQLDDLLATNIIFAKDWADTTEIDLSDPITQEALTGAGIDVNIVKLAI